MDRISCLCVSLVKASFLFKFHYESITGINSNGLDAFVNIMFNQITICNIIIYVIKLPNRIPAPTR